MYKYDDPWSSSEEESESYEFEADTYSKLKFVAGRQEIGGSDEGGESTRIFVEFEAGSFNDDDEVIVLAQVEAEEGQTWTDVYGTTVVDQNPEGFAVNVGRGGDNKTWGQNAVLNWVAVCARNNPLVQTFEAHVGKNSDGGSCQVEVKFDAPLAKGMRPFLMATCKGEDYSDSFACTLKKVTRHRATFNVARINEHGQGWGQDGLTLNVLMFAQGVFPTLRVDVGGSDDNTMTVEDLEFGGKLRRRPIPLVMIQHPSDAQDGWGDAFLSSIANVTRETFQLNMMRMDQNSGWGMNARVMVALIP